MRKYHPWTDLSKREELRFLSWHEKIDRVPFHSGTISCTFVSCGPITSASADVPVQCSTDPDGASSSCAAGASGGGPFSSSFFRSWAKSIFSPLYGRIHNYTRRTHFSAKYAVGIKRGRYVKPKISCSAPSQYIMELRKALFR